MIWVLRFLLHIEEATHSALHLQLFSVDLLMFRTYTIGILFCPFVHRHCASRVGIHYLLMVLPSETVRVIMHHLSKSSFFSFLFEADRRERLSRQRSGNIAVMMVGNKSDLNHLRSVPEEDRQPGIFVRRRKACPSSRHLPLEGGNKRREGVPHHTILSEIHQTLSKKALAAQQSASANGRSMHGTNHH